MFSIQFHAKIIKYVGLAPAVVERVPVHQYNTLHTVNSLCWPVDGSNAPFYLYSAYKRVREEEEVKPGRLVKLDSDPVCLQSYFTLRWRLVLRVCCARLKWIINVIKLGIFASRKNICLWKNVGEHVPALLLWRSCMEDDTEWTVAGVSFENYKV